MTKKKKSPEIRKSITGKGRTESISHFFQLLHNLGNFAGFHENSSCLLFILFYFFIQQFSPSRASSWFGELHLVFWGPLFNYGVEPRLAENLFCSIDPALMFLKLSPWDNCQLQGAARSLQVIWGSISHG